MVEEYRCGARTSLVADMDNALLSYVSLCVLRCLWTLQVAACASRLALKDLRYGLVS